MPKPSYIICSQSGAFDEQDERVSIFEVAESIMVANTATAARALPLDWRPGHLTVRITTCWMREDSDDPAQQFETQVAILFPDGSDAMASNVIPFHFEKRFYRRIFSHVPLELPIDFPEGIYSIEGRLRKTGEQTWSIRQVFPMLVEYAPEPSQRSLN
jgi:hypothetical protein